MHSFLSRYLRSLTVLVFLSAAFTCGLPQYVVAAPVEEKCSDDTTKNDLIDTKYDTTVISDVAARITDILGGLSSNMFQDVARGLNPTINLLVTLYILIYGLLFMFGAVQITIFDFITRFVKLVIVAMLLNGGAQIYVLMFNFFENGMDDILNVVTSSIFGGQVLSGGSAGPLASLDELVSKIISPKTIVIISTIWRTGPNGIILFFIISASLMSIMSAIMNALWVYLMSKVVRTLLFGLAPLFIACLLFQHTRHYFQSWLNQLVSSCLQPIFLFAFFAFFASILTGVIGTIVDAPVCMVKNRAHPGSPSAVYEWAFKVKEKDANGQWNGKWKVYRGAWTSTGSQRNVSSTDKKDDIFPIDIFAIVVFFILAELASRMNSIVIALANGIASASTNLSTMSGLLEKSGQGTGGGDKPKLLAGEGGGAASGAAAKIRELSKTRDVIA
ncbi:MAG: type IV secretion system protein [Alphaproteobacteria bacterium]|nr:type IV secretion system protein [Alphaproteobacteria bacterium]